MLIDLHNHTSPFSACSIITPEALVDRALDSKLDGLVFTEHDTWFDDTIRGKLQQHAGVKLQLFTGIEHTIPGFHVLSIGEKIACGPWDSLDDLESCATGRDVVLILAHPWRWGAVDRFRDEQEQLEFFRRFDAIEVLSDNLDPQEQLAGWKFCRKHDLAICGGSDAHSPSMAATYATHFSVKIRTETELAAALRSGDSLPEKL